MRKLVSIGLAGAAFAASPAYAQTQITAVADPSIPAWTTATIIQDFTTSNPNGSQFVPNSTIEDGAGVETIKDTGGENKIRVLTTEVPTLPGLTGDYLFIGNGSGYTLTFAQPVSYFSFTFNGVQNQNKVTLNYANNTTQSLTGSSLIGGTSLTSGRVTYDTGTGPQIVSISFTGGKESFTIDSFAAAAPEPAAWGMMLLGFGIAGSQLRRRRRQSALITA